MDSLIILALGFLPFFILFYLLLIKKESTLKTMPIVCFLTMFIALFIWKMQINFITAAFTRGTLIALEIILIIFGAIWILEIIKRKKKDKEILKFLSSVSPDIRIQIILVAWFFGGLLEGLAGFGTPAAIVAPILVTLGFSPISAVVLALISNSSPVTFGAAGTPILLGFGSLGLQKETLNQIGIASAAIHSICSLMIIFVLIYITNKELNISNKKGLLKEMIPFIFVSWIIFIIPYLLTAFFIGPELPSIIASLTGIFFVIFFVKMKLFLPERIVFLNKIENKKEKIKFNSFIPYLLIILFLVISRVIKPVKNYLSEIKLSWENIFQSSVNYSYQPFFTPAFYFIITAVFCIFIYSLNKYEIKETLKSTFNKIKIPFISLIFTLGFVQILIYSSFNLSNLPAIPVMLAENITSILNNFYPLFAPLIGWIGAFITGSNTVSNILFGAFQLESAKTLGISIIIILALQAVGGAVGNMLAIHNILAASATVNLHGKEGEIIKRIFFISIIYALIAGLIGLIIIKFIG